MEMLQHLLSTNGFMPHGHCYLWKPALVALHLLSDGLIALAYTSIPFTLVYFVRKRHDVPFNWIFFCFGVFITLAWMFGVQRTLHKPFEARELLDAVREMLQNQDEGGG
jgi:hypothetical protein